MRIVAPSFSHGAMGMNITLKQLRVFCAVYETRSFTAAARATHVTQSAVSKLCAELEAEVGLPLFVRSTRSVVPCDGAADFYAYAQEILGSVRAAERSLSSLGSLARGTVGIASSPMMMVGLLADVIAEYHRAYPAVRMDLYELSTDDTIEYVRQGRADFGLVSTDTLGEEFVADEVYRDSMFAVFPPGHRLADKARVQWKELAVFTHIALRNVYSVRRTVDRIQGELGLTFKATIEAGMLTSVLRMVAADLGITIVPGYVCEFARQLGLQTVPIGAAKQYRHPLWLIRRRTARPSIAASAFLDRLLPYLKARESARR
jgi:DNA-binding transcriptional LysR family regulator